MVRAWTGAKVGERRHTADSQGKGSHVGDLRSCNFLLESLGIETFQKEIWEAAGELPQCPEAKKLCSVMFSPLGSFSIRWNPFQSELNEDLEPGVVWQADLDDFSQRLWRGLTACGSVRINQFAQSTKRVSDLRIKSKDAIL